mgnify:CR=1 FL=1
MTNEQLQHELMMERTGHEATKRDLEMLIKDQALLLGKIAKLRDQVEKMTPKESTIARLTRIADGLKASK